MINKESIKKVINKHYDTLEDKVNNISNKLEESSSKTQKEIEKVKELFNLRNTNFIIDPTTIESICDTSRSESKNVVCVLINIKDAVHEGVHAFFEERSQKLWDKLGENKWKKNIDHITTIQDLEEITARIIELNVANKIIDICDENIRDIIDKNFVSAHYADKRLGTEINQIKSIYDFYCIKSEEKELYNKLKNKTDPIEVYNILAERVRAPKLM